MDKTWTELERERDEAASRLSAGLGGTPAQLECLVEVLTKTCESLKSERDQYREGLERIVTTLNQPGEPNRKFEDGIQAIAREALGFDA